MFFLHIPRKVLGQEILAQFTGDKKYKNYFSFIEPFVFYSSQKNISIVG